ncbi:hypothetical protein ES703_41191 [subsurface metagenome]
MKVTTKIAPVKGIGKPDYSREVSSALQRVGISLKYNQTAVILAKSFSAINTGTHTAAMNPFIMTDATATFTPNILIGFTILNVTDGSSGTIIANTVNTVTVIALTGGVTNRWNPGDAYIIPSPFAWVQTPLAPGASAHLVDISTGDDTPYTVPVGYTLTLVEMATAFSEDVESGFYMDFPPLIPLSLTSVGIHGAGMPIIQTKLLPISTSLIDPLGTVEHNLDGIYTNVGAGNMTGGIDILCILEAVGTQPLPKDKKIKCKFCNHREVVPKETTIMKCPKCEQLNVYANASAFRRAS